MSAITAAKPAALNHRMRLPPRVSLASSANVAGPEPSTIPPTGTGGVGVTKHGVAVTVAVFVGPPGVLVAMGVPGVAVGQGRKQPSGGHGISVGVGHPAGGHGVIVGGSGVTVCISRQGVCVGGTVLVGPPGVLVGPGVTGSGVGHGKTHPVVGQGVKVGGDGNGVSRGLVGVWVGVTEIVSRQGGKSGVFVGSPGRAVGQLMMQPVVGQGVGVPANGVGVAFTTHGVPVGVSVTVDPPGVTVSVGVTGVGVGHLASTKSSADADWPSTWNPITNSAADASAARIAACNAIPFIPLPFQDRMRQRLDAAGSPPDTVSIRPFRKSSSCEART